MRPRPAARSTSSASPAAYPAEDPTATAPAAATGSGCPFDGDGKLIRRVRRMLPHDLHLQLKARRPEIYRDSARVEVRNALFAASSDVALQNASPEDVAAALVRFTEQVARLGERRRALDAGVLDVSEGEWRPVPAVPRRGTGGEAADFGPPAWQRIRTEPTGVEVVMSEVQAEGFGASASEASSAAEGVGDVGGWDVGVQWQGPSAEEWQATQQAIGEIASLLGVQEEPESAFDPFADDFAEQVRAVAREEIEPIRETFGQLQQQASLDKGNAELSSIVAGLAAELGADLDEAEVRADAHRRVEGVASGLMVEAGLSAEQISAVLASDPLVAYKILAASFEDEVSSPDEVARWALLTAGRILHEQATKPRSPSEVLRRSFPTQPPGQRSQPAARGPYGVLAKHQKLNEGRRS